MPLLSIAENIFLGNEVATRGVIDWEETFSRTEELLRKVGLREQPTTLVTDIGVGKQQLVEIAKALSKRVKLLILDEPTASLQETDSQKLLDLLLEFKAQGITSILISHKLNEVGRVADRITVLRDGATVSTLDTPRRDDQRGPDHPRHGRPRRCPTAIRRASRRSASVLFEVEDWNVFHQVHADRQQIYDVSLNVRAGEIVGIAGLMGSGRTELAMSMFGRSYGHHISGTAKLHGQPIDVVDRRRGGRLRPRLRHRGPQEPRADPRGPHHPQHHAGEPARRLEVRRDRRPRRAAGGARLPQADEHPHADGLPEGAEPLRRQPAEGGAVEVAVLRPRGADPRRADARHRRRRQVRDLHADQRAGRPGQGGDHDLLRDARAARHVRPHLRHEGGRVRRRAAGGGGQPGAHHAHDRRTDRAHGQHHRHPRPPVDRRAPQGTTSASTACCWRSSSSWRSSRS